MSVWISSNLRKNWDWSCLITVNTLFNNRRLDGSLVTIGIRGSFWWILGSFVVATGGYFDLSLVIIGSYLDR